MIVSINLFSILTLFCYTLMKNLANHFSFIESFWSFPLKARIQDSLSSLTFPLVPLFSLTFLYMDDGGGGRGDLVTKSFLTLCNPMDCGPAQPLCPLYFPGKNTRMGCHFFHQGNLPDQGSNPGLLHCRQIL